MKAVEIDCPIVKWPAALLMQNVEGFLVNTGQRELWLGSRRNAAGKELTADLYKPDRNYNTASPVMPTPKERKKLKEYRESEIPSVKFDDLELREKSRCWSTSQACSVKIVDKEGMKALVRKLNVDRFCETDFQVVIDSRLAAMTATVLYKEREMGKLQRDFEPRCSRNDNQMLTSWSMRALSVQVDMILAFFGLSNKELNCVNRGEPAETVQRRVQLCGQFVRLIMRDSGIFAIIARPDAPIFLKWLASAIPVALLDQLIPPGGEIVRSAENLDFCLKLVMLLGEVMKVATDQDRVAHTNLNRDERARRTDTFVYLNLIRQGRNFHVSQGLSELSSYMSREEFNRKSKNIVQEETPDLAYSPFDQSSHYDAYNRYTICRKLSRFTEATIIVGGRLPAKKLGSIIDYKCNVDLLSHELIEVTLILHG